MNTFDLTKFDVPKFDAILARGLSAGKGEQEGQMCIEAAICSTLGLPHGDDPGCVAVSVRSFKIALNDKNWSSPQARAAGLRDLGLAQLGSQGTVDSVEFSKRLSHKVISILLPMFIRELFPLNQALLDAAIVCEKEGTSASARALYTAAVSAAYAGGDKYLLLDAKLALDVLKELNSPGVALLNTGELMRQGVSNG